jgi:hypothetical protein
MANLYQAFADLFSQSPLLVGEVIATNSNGAIIELPDGSAILARGSATVGQFVFVRGGAIEGLAPSLTAVEINV